MTAPARRPWRKKNRSAAAGLLWLAVAYPLSVGPLQYAEVRAGVPQLAWLPYVPLVAALELSPPLRDATLVPYLQRWQNLATRHQAAAQGAAHTRR